MGAVSCRIHLITERQSALPVLVIEGGTLAHESGIGAGTWLLSTARFRCLSNIGLGLLVFFTLRLAVFVLSHGRDARSL
jgi:hypothetical protein